MKKSVLFLLTACFVTGLAAQPVFRRAPAKVELTDMKKFILEVQGNADLYTQNLDNHSREHDVNSIILDIEKYIDTAKNRTSADQLLIKFFNPLRHFFLTTTNKTTVATSFLYTGNPYQFCSYNDTALALYLFAIKDGNTYNLAKMTDKKVIRSVVENCMLPAFKAVDEFKDSPLKYIGLSVYYGCKDTREGAPAGVVVPYCLTLVASAGDLQQYAAGLITTKGLLSNSDLYFSDEEDKAVLRRIRVNVE